MVTEGILKYLDGFLAPSDFRHKIFLAQLNVFFKVLGSKSGASARLQKNLRPHRTTPERRRNIKKCLRAAYTIEFREDVRTPLERKRDIFIQ